LEELFPDRVDEFSGLMAYHFEAAEAHEKALDYLQRAGDQARLAYAHQEAIDFYERALVILRDQEEFDRAARTLMKLGLTYHTAFDYKRSRGAYDEAFALRQRGSITKQETLEPAPHPFRLVSNEPPTLDPSKFHDTTSGKIILAIFSSLVEFDAGWEIIPDVAQRWEISEDGRRYVFHLRDDVTWSDGSQVTAADFVYSWIRTLNPATEALVGKAGLLFDIKNARAYYEGDITESDQVGVRAIDKLTLEVELERAASYFLQMLYTLFPVPGHVVETYGDAWTDMEHIVTNGAFQIESYEPGQFISLVRSPTYHGGFSGNLEKVDVKLHKRTRSPEELELYETDRVDVAILGDTTYHARYRYAEEYVSEPMQNLFFVGFDTSRPPFADVRVRRAFAMAVDRQKLAYEVLEGFTDPAIGGFVPPTIPGHSPRIGLPYDPAQARKLLAQAGYPEGQGFLTVELVWVDTLKQLQYLKSQWNDILNIEVKIEITEWENVLRTIRSKNVFHMGWLSDYPDPDSYLSVCVRNLLPGWRDDKYDALLEEAQRTLNQPERIRLYQQADKILIEEAVVIPIIYAQDHYLVKPWAKLPLRPYEGWDFKDVIIEPH
jgi:oligopeptide transport system substrate-binding protein